MKRIFIFPTIGEAKAFILTQPRDPVFVAGVGAAEIAAATIRAVKARKPQLVVLAGIAGACDRTLQRGEVVEVVTERIAGIPERYAREYETTGPDLGLPLAAGVTVNRSGDGLQKTGRGCGNAAGTARIAIGDSEVSAASAEGTAGDAENTPGNAGIAAGEAKNTGADSRDTDAETEITDAETEITDTDARSAALPEIENMEGAAFFAVCEALGVACCQIRAVSNYVGEPFDRWAVEEAVENLTGKLTQIFGNDE